MVHRSRDRAAYPEADHPHHARVFVGGVRAALARAQDDPDIVALVEALHARSPAFTELWNAHDVSVRMSATKRMLHPEVGEITLDCQKLSNEDEAQALLVYTATPGTEDRDKLDLLAVIGAQRFAR